jgi:hypothetical protein
MNAIIGTDGRQRKATVKAHEAASAVLRRHERDRASTLSTLWIFAALNYLYCDVVSLMDRKLLAGYLVGNVGGLHITSGFLVGAAALVEIPMAMVLVSRVAKYPTNRWANVVAASVMTVVQAVTLFVGSTAVYYLLFSIIEIACTAFIVWYAWTWRLPALAVDVPDPRPATL